MDALNDVDAESLAKKAYAIWRGQDVFGNSLHWDDLREIDRAPFIFVAKFVATLVMEEGAAHDGAE